MLSNYEKFFFSERGKKREGLEEKKGGKNTNTNDATQMKSSFPPLNARLSTLWEGNMDQKTK